MSNDLKALKVGDTAWIVGYAFTSYGKEKGPVPMLQAVVTKVGRKYITVLEVGKPAWAEAKFSLDGGWNEHDPSYPQRATRRLYVDINHYIAARRLSNIRAQFTDAFRGYSAAIDPRVTAEEILAAAKLLRIDIKE